MPVDLKVTELKDMPSGNKVVMSGVISVPENGLVTVTLTAKGRDMELIADALGIDGVGYGKKFQAEVNESRSEE
jgi:hypothetical protein